MKHKNAILGFLLASALIASAAQKQYQDAAILGVEQKTNTRVLYYIVNTPITKDEPYYEVSLQLRNVIYLARYTPRHANDTLPDEWNAGSKVELRVAGRHVFVKCEGESDIELIIIKRKDVKMAESQSSSANK